MMTSIAGREGVNGPSTQRLIRTQPAAACIAARQTSGAPNLGYRRLPLAKDAPVPKIPYIAVVTGERFMDFYQVLVQ